MTPKDVDFIFTVSVAFIGFLGLIWCGFMVMADVMAHRDEKRETKKWADRLKRFRGEL